MLAIFSDRGTGVTENRDDFCSCFDRNFRGLGYRYIFEGRQVERHRNSRQIPQIGKAADDFEDAQHPFGKVAFEFDKLAHRSKLTH